MHGLSIFLLVMGGLLVTSFSSHATQDTNMRSPMLTDDTDDTVC